MTLTSEEKITFWKHATDMQDAAEAVLHAFLETKAGKPYFRSKGYTFFDEKTAHCPRYTPRKEMLAWSEEEWTEHKKLLRNISTEDSSAFYAYGDALRTTTITLLQDEPELFMKIGAWLQSMEEIDTHDFMEDLALHEPRIKALDIWELEASVEFSEFYLAAQS